MVRTVVRRASADEPAGYRSQVLVGPARRGSLRVYTRSRFGATQPRFSPDGSRLAFLSREADAAPAQAYVLPLEGGEARAVTSLPGGVLACEWHPDGKRLLCVAPPAAPEPDAGRARRIRLARYRAEGTGMLPDRPAQLYAVSVASGRARQLTELAHGVSSLSVAPDGAAVYFQTADDDADHDAMRTSIHRLELTADGRAGTRAGNLTRVVGPMRGLGRAVPSPDGGTLAFLAPSKPDDIASPTGLWRVAARGEAAPRLLTAGRQASHGVSGDARYGTLPQDPRWDGNEALIFVLSEDGASCLARVAIDGGLMRWGVSERVVTSFDFRDGLALLTAESPTQPGELYLRGPRDEEVQRTRLNAAWTRRFRLREPTPVRELRTASGVRVPYWTLPPVRTRRDEALVLQVHGGPHAAYGYGFLFEFHLLSARGYTVVYGNPRGGSGYGPDFLAAVLGDYGGGDAKDVLAIADDALERHRDPAAPMHLTGGSYGGFMTNWLLGTTDRFRSAVTQRSICNWTSMYGTSDIGPGFTEREIGGNPWEAHAELWRQSPLRHVQNVVTPTLVIHGEQDLRCPIEQGEQWFNALKRVGRVDTAFLRFPEEGHELSRSGRPDRRVERLEAIVDWFERHA